MSTIVAISLPPEELAELDGLRRDQGVSRAEAIRQAVRWYAQWGERLPFEDPIADDIES
jgi:metal-responsive CopG/Arc/MetJ family transcriptional regulator